ncbi:CAMK family protein kinase [Tritrichomonas foetus]|uniref:CAMK family protein kinase n=1 Tax=Tritrichomonas foetus TaxID=1144522 RepID=A0A1J4JGW2_9EUKA|nr:CAMK family protein kinase [Tritrichomonas foetus]|eukprot:OHS96492.1 CAMK family protein kinase [Tritrichomonas foetus]
MRSIKGVIFSHSITFKFDRLLYKSNEFSEDIRFHFFFFGLLSSMETKVNIPYGAIIHDYIFQERIGKGGFGAVYMVTSMKFNTEFVAKVILPHDTNVSAAWESFDSEVSALIKLDYPNIIRLYDHFTVDGLFFLILEYCSHGSLYDEVKENGPLKGLRLMTVCQQLISAVYNAHKNNIAHRDIKPQNILLDDFGRVKLADFGISICSNERDTFQDFKCSPAFAPPEVLRKDPHDIFKADLWSLGVTLYFVSTGELPYKFHSKFQILDQMKQLGISITRKSAPNSIFAIIKGFIVYDPAKRMSIDEAYSIIHSEHNERISKAASALSKFPTLKAPPEPEIIRFNSGIKAEGSSLIVKPNLADKPISFGVKVKKRRSNEIRRTNPLIRPSFGSFKNIPIC